MAKNTQQNSTPLYDGECERILISAIFNYGDEVFYDISTLVNQSDFYEPENKLIWSKFEKSINIDKITKPDIDTVLTAIRETDPSLISRYNIMDYCSELQNRKVAKDKISHYTKIVARYGVMRKFFGVLGEAQKELAGADVARPILDIIADAEGHIFNFNHQLLNANNKTKHIGDDIDDLLNNFIMNQQMALGIPTGIQAYDHAIGGGIRAPGVAVIAARPKVGKTSLAAQISVNVAKLGIPVLVLDTEMSFELMQTKILACVSKVDINHIERGTFYKDLIYKPKVDQAKAILGTIPLDYQSVSGISHYQIISLCRKWLHKTVGFDTNGNIKPHLIILDYIKTMNLGEMGQNQEYQYLGQYLTDLHNFCKEMNSPMLAFVQQNREGVNRDDSLGVSGSDRILWLCTSLSTLKRKTPEDEVTSPMTDGNRKLIISDCRFGPGLNYGEYINLKMDLGKCSLEEGPLNTYSKNLTSDDDITV